MMETPVKESLEVTVARIDERTRSIEESGKTRDARLARIEAKVDLLSSTLRFARGAAWVIIPLLVFLGGLLITHLTHHDIAIVPASHAETK